MLMAPRRNMRMPAGLHIGVHANRYERQSVAAADASRRLFQQNFEFRLGLDIEEQYSGPIVVLFALAICGHTILESFANLFTRLAHSGKHYAIAANADGTEHLEFATRNNVETVSSFRDLLQDREIAVGFHGEAQRVRQRTKAAMQFGLRIINRRATVGVSRRVDFAGDVDKSHSFARDGLRSA